MILLDENVIERQRDLLRNWGVAIHCVGDDIGRRGIKDDQIVALLHGLRATTFFTRDLDFYNRALCHTRYCLVCLVVDKSEFATFTRRFLGHRLFNTEAKRMGNVIRVSSAGLNVWRLRAEREVNFAWDRP